MSTVQGIIKGDNYSIWKKLFISHGDIQCINVDHKNKKFVYRVYRPVLRRSVVNSDGIFYTDIITNESTVDNQKYNYLDLHFNGIFDEYDVKVQQLESKLEKVISLRDNLVIHNSHGKTFYYPEDVRVAPMFYSYRY